MDDQLNRIKTKLKELSLLDKGHSLFGAQSHKYILNPPVSKEQITGFESKYAIKLPEEYVLFLTELGNGGAGPFYGLEPFENVLYEDLDYKKEENLLNPSIPFPHTIPWNMDFEPTVDEEENEEEFEKQMEEFNNVYYSSEQMTGAIALSNYGCGISINLVVNGDEYGYLWTDDRGNDGGIYPSFELGNEKKIKFLDWYELWLDTSLEQIRKKEESKKEETSGNKDQGESREEKNNTKNKWWKFW